VSLDVGRLIHYRKRHNLSQYQQEKNSGFLAQSKWPTAGAKLIMNRLQHKKAP